MHLNIKTIVKKTLEYLIPGPTLHFRAYKNLIWNRSSYLHLTGWMKSLGEGNSISYCGDPIPWMNYPMVKLLDERLTLDLRLFEFGSGFSTFYFSEKINRVTSVEYDRKWYDKVRVRAGLNAKIIFQAEDVDGDYCRVVRMEKECYDVIIIDGRDRVNCFKQSISSLSTRGIIVLDDSHRDKYSQVFAIARESGFKSLNIEGLKATGNGIDRSTIFYREGNCLNI